MAQPQAMALPMNPPSSLPLSHSQTRFSDLSGRADEARKFVLSILMDTDWPKETANDVQALIDTMKTLPDLDQIRNVETRIGAEITVSIELLLKELESVRTRLKRESQKYGTKKKGFRKKFKKLFSRIDESKCPQVLQDCRNDLEECSTALNKHLRNPDPSFGSSPVPRVSRVASVGPSRQKGSGVRKDSLNDAKKALKLTEGVSGALPVVGTFVGAVAKVGLTVTEMLQAIHEKDEMAEKLGTHISRLSNILEWFGNQRRQLEASQTGKRIEDLQGVLRDLQHEIAEQQSQLRIKNFWNSIDQVGDLKKLEDKVHTALEEIQLLVSLKTSILVEDLHNESTQSKHRHLLNCLGDGKYGAQGNAIEDVTCLPDTRVRILERIDEWIRGGSNSERVLWILGMAGRGKSTLASTVAHNWKGRACCAIYHFRRGQISSNTSLICTLAKQLGKSLDPELKNAILSTVEENEDIANQRLDEQFAAIFVASLGAMKGKRFPILVVVDGLDECDSVDYVVDFVKLIKRHSSSLPDNLKFLLTSRPEAPLLRALEPRTWLAENLDSIDDVDEDIERFLRHALLQVKAEHEIEGLWPPPSDIVRLAKMSQGLFQWARTAVKYIEDGSPADQLAELLKSPTVWSGVDELYTQILSKALEKVKRNPAKRDLLLSVLGTLVVAPHPVSLEIIAFLHAEHELIKGKTPEMVFNFLRRGILADLNSLLFVPSSSSDPIQLMHASISDLLVDRERCGGGLYWVDIARSHQRLAAACILQMNRHLRKNICNLNNLSKPSSELQAIPSRELSAGLQYCCRSWSVHLASGGQAAWPGTDNQVPLERDFQLFSEEKILFWLEFMSLVGSSNEAIIMAKQVHEWLSQELDETSGFNWLVKLWNDVHRFAAAFSEPIAFSPLHIYASALAHCPVNTELWRRYKNHATVLTIRGVQPPTWSSDLWTRSFGSEVNSVAFSPDGALLASGSHDHTVRLWDPHTGRQIGEPLAGHSGIVWSVSFSADGKLLASGSGDKTIRLWDIQTGKQVGEPLKGHSDAVFSVCFSPDSKLLASGSDDATIQVWDLQTGKQMGKPLKGHRGDVSAVCFSPDGKLLASGSDDRTIRLWDPRAGSQVGDPLRGHRDDVYAVCFSPDSRLLASGSGDKTIRLWDPETGKQIGEPLARHISLVRSVSFSPDGKLLASGSYDQTIRLWDPKTGSQVGEPLQGHSYSVQSVCFSPDGKLLVSGSKDNTIRGWDPTIMMGDPLTGQSHSVRSVCFSPNGKLLASGSYDDTIRLLDPQTGSQVGEPLIGHTETVCAVSFSPDGKLLASGSWDRTIRIWDLQTGRQRGAPLINHSDSVYSICFSPDGKLLASGSRDRTIRLWNFQTGKQVGEPLTGHSETVCSVCFSPDSKLLASGSWDRTIRVSDLRTGKQVGEPLVGHIGVIKSVWFSPDGKFITGCDHLGHSISWDAFTLQRCDCLPSIPSHAALSFRDHWITFSSARLFWLPPKYWGDTFSNHVVILSQGKIAVVHDNTMDKTLAIFDASDALNLYNHLHL